jgi:prepilin-type N-terminal cleavage/methylation domain-containing protein
MNRNPSSANKAFSLIELLVVIAVIAVLTSLLLPVLTKAKDRAKLAVCTSNVRQVGLALKMYVSDAGRFPYLYTLDEDRRSKWNLDTVGGKAPIPSHAPYWLSEGKRPLFRYLAPSRVYQCTADAGSLRSGPGAPAGINHKPSAYGTVGCSYLFNNGPLATPAGGGFRKGRDGFLAGQQESWIPDPTKYIVLFEPPAGLNGGFNQWHNSRGQTHFNETQVTNALKQFISPIAFADGHVAVHNFSDAIQRDPLFPHEETKDWMWYKPARP